MEADGDLPRRLLPAPVRALESRPRGAEPGRADRFSQPPLLFLLHRAVAVGGLLLHRTPDSCGRYPLLDERAGGANLVRLSVPPNRLDRPVLRRRALGRR